MTRLISDRYAFATLFGNLGGIRSCNVYTLRLFNTLVLIATMAYASDCRELITRAWKRESKDERDDSESHSPNSMHTALNTALFPPLFFFSGLFYTDVLSTCVVLRIYRLFLQQKGSAWVYVAGVLALTMRQTNIFWVAVFLGGLEVVGMIKVIEAAPLKQPSEPQTWKESATSELQRYCRGEIHDIPLKDAEVQGISTRLHQTNALIITRFYPLRYQLGRCRALPPNPHYPKVMAVFSAPHFIRSFRFLERRCSSWYLLFLHIPISCLVNKTLGDKSNHIATIHFPQLLYLFAFIAFFSGPLLIPSIIYFLRPFVSLLVPSLASKSASSPPTPIWKILSTGIFGLGLFFVILLMIHTNTLIHPFTLADNRHYIFYVFRYTILFHPLVRYLLAPIYLVCFYLCYRTLSTSSSSASATQSTPSSSSPISKPTSPRAEIQQRIHNKSQAGTLKVDAGPSTSFFLVWFLATALSLITAPLVEPRYFIVPWVVWRLHVPSYSSSPSPAERRGGKKSARLTDVVKFYLWRGYDYRLWVETAWFLAINAATGYVFLYRGFNWPQEPGMVQRFMW
jgi:alpha-1,2-glucosyltransferase